MPLAVLIDSALQGHFEELRCRCAQGKIQSSLK